MVDSEDRERCTKRLAQSVRKNVKFHSNPAKTVQYTARIASQSAKKKAVNKRIVNPFIFVA